MISYILVTLMIDSRGDNVGRNNTLVTDLKSQGVNTWTTVT